MTDKNLDAAEEINKDEIAETVEVVEEKNQEEAK
jgi:hypothetical protein